MASSTAVCVFVAVILSLSLTEGAEYNGRMSSDSIRFDNFARHPHYLPKRQAAGNMTSTNMDDHEYYTSEYYPPGSMAESLWIDLTNVDATAHNISGEYRYFAVHDLKFDFSFYGHIVNSVAITTAGFIYVGTYLHRFLYLTQYIAPLQADFNPGLNESATVLVYGTEDRFTIQWDKVHNHDHVESGTFTFQLTLFKGGVIHFAYREIPLNLTEISNRNHPVEVGLADSFYIDRPIPGGFILRTIYEYHKVDLQASNNLSYSAYVLTPLPNCIMASSCDQCVSTTRSSSFECGWCDSLNRCSDGFDRHRQEWFTSGCSDSSTTGCSSGTTATQTSTSTTTTTTSIVQQGLFQSIRPSRLTTGTIIGIAVSGFVVLLLVVLIFAVCIGVLIYGYKKPNSRIGLYIIEHRPKARSLNKTKGTLEFNNESGKVQLT